MTTSEVEVAGSRGRRWPWGLMRATLTLLAALTFAQPTLAGQFLAGNVDMVGLHAAVAYGVVLLTIVQTLAAVLLWRPGRGPAWPILAGIALFVLVVLQLVMGHSERLAVHVPLGVGIVAIALLQLLWVWLPRGSGRDR